MHSKFIKFFSLISILFTFVPFVMVITYATDNDFDAIIAEQERFENKGYYTEEDRNSENWDTTIAYGTLQSYETQNGMEIAEIANNGGMIIETTGAYNYTAKEGLDTTSVESSINALVSEEMAQKLRENNYGIQLGYYPREDKSAVEWYNESNNQGIYDITCGDGWAEMSEAQKQAYAKDAGKNHSIMMLTQSDGWIPGNTSDMYMSEVAYPSDDGVLIIPLGDIPDGVYAGAYLYIVDLTTNERVAISEFDPYNSQPTFKKGDVDENSIEDDDDEEEQKTPTGNHVWHSDVPDDWETSDLDPNITSRIFNKDPSNAEKYSVQVSIPTSERVIYEISAKKATHDITVRKRTLAAGVNEIELVISADYYWEQWDPVKWDKKGRPTKYDWVTHKGTVSRVLPDKYTRSFSKICYEVIKSDITPVSYGNLIAKREDYILDSGKIELEGMTGPRTTP